MTEIAGYKLPSALPVPADVTAQEEGNMSVVRMTIIHLAMVWLMASLIVSADAGSLNGVVVGKAENPRPYVRVEISGPENRITFTNQDGKFSIALRDGRYTINVIEAGRRAEFTADVSASAPPVTFRLGW